MRCLPLEIRIDSHPLYDLDGSKDLFNRYCEQNEHLFRIVRSLRDSLPVVMGSVKLSSLSWSIYTLLRLADDEGFTHESHPYEEDASESTPRNKNKVITRKRVSRRDTEKECMTTLQKRILNTNNPSSIRNEGPPCPTQRPALVSKRLLYNTLAPELEKSSEHRTHLIHPTSLRCCL